MFRLIILLVIVIVFGTFFREICNLILLNIRQLIISKYVNHTSCFTSLICFQLVVYATLWRLMLKL